eukprot:CAMPEP_0204826896 /NCGR_PEP_ID=MMETSP1346-20131115/4497_1 /ASSEMBLY_ACC=CAM_ASM_000771 /TAXON_ID=215587 /ORGANISM="Aplanochytrium stocchinoi, Strain GSBS06" /LENGTH=230 /DNA_ID=CAMNT_0051955127 /DNA_START=472 /DNA_END=1165 /DNA_ORIENTATION=+
MACFEDAGADFSFDTVTLPNLKMQNVDHESTETTEVDLADLELESRREKGSVTGLFPVLYVGDVPIHESLAIAEFAADAFPDAKLWPDSIVERALARAISQEMATGFPNVRDQLSCHVFARVPDLKLRSETEVEVERIKEIWKTCLNRSGGPFLFGTFSIADCMYFPVVTRFRTYNIPLTPDLEEYCQQMENQPAVIEWKKEALKAPSIPIYDEYIRSIGGDPIAEYKPI